MKRLLKAGFVFTAMLAIPAVAIAQTTIRDLQSANSTSLSGEIVQIFSEDFILDDGTGQILVEADDRPLRQADFQVGEQVTVTGTYDDDNSFDAIQITRQDGEVVQIFED
ncbi:MAG: hypothetical protein Kow00121_29720 [Elainellaceae cyanobacterium]